MVRAALSIQASCHADEHLKAEAALALALLDEWHRNACEQAAERQRTLDARREARRAEKDARDAEMGIVRKRRKPPDTSWLLDKPDPPRIELLTSPESKRKLPSFKNRDEMMAYIRARSSYGAKPSARG